MKILWVAEPVLPRVAQMTGRTPSYAGGWLVSVCDALLCDPENSLMFCCRMTGEHVQAADGRFSCWSFQQDPLCYSPKLERSFRSLLREEQPDVIHIWGTEFPFTLAMLNAAEREGMLERTLVSIQGLISLIARRYTAALPGSVADGRTLRDVLRRDGIRQQQEKFTRRGVFEIAALKKTRHVIGRTEWDKAGVRQINPNAAYHVCNETLRPEFYEDAWRLDACDRHSIFVAQGNYPIKGLHQALKALAILKQKVPGVMLRTTGEDPRNGTLRSRLRRSSYARYIAKSIRSLGLDEHVSFLGTLSAEEMRDQYLRAHVALNPSAIENSSNAIGEAMLLGTPVVASRVGGTPDIVQDGVEGILYPFGEPEQLADAVLRIFGSDALAKSLSAEGRETALRRHDVEKNDARLREIYLQLAKRKER